MKVEIVLQGEALALCTEAYMLVQGLVSLIVQHPSKLLDIVAVEITDLQTLLQPKRLQPVKLWLCIILGEWSK